MSFLLHRAFAKASERFSSKLAVADKARRLSYSELQRAADQLASQLGTHSISRGSRVGFLFEHAVEQAICIWAISAVDCVFVPINEKLLPDQVEHILNDSEAEILLVSPRILERLGAPLKSSAMQIAYRYEPAETAPTRQELFNRNIENDLAALLYTSGSTGKPKGVMVSHKNLLVGSDIVCEYLSICEKDRLLGILPLSFDYGLNQLITMLTQGGTYFFCEFKFPQEIVTALKEFEITGLAGIPTLWALLVRSALSKTDLPHLRYLSNSGGAVPTSILEKLRKAVPNTEVFLMYGLTEAFRSSFLHPSELNTRPTSMGKAIPNTELFVLDESGNPCAPGQVGELVHRGPTVALGYWRSEGATRERYRPFPCPHGASPIGETVVYSGDLVTTDEEGFLYFVGRKDAMIKRSGFRISPSEIEEIVYKLPFIKSAAAVGIDHPQEGQTIKVYVVCSGDATEDEQVLQTGLREHCSTHLPRHMIPSSFEFIKELPKTATGKVDYPALKQRN